MFQIRTFQLSGQLTQQHMILHGMKTSSQCLHSPVQCCLIHMQQGSTVEKPRAARKLPYSVRLPQKVLRLQFLFSVSGDLGCAFLRGFWVNKHGPFQSELSAIVFTINKTIEHITYILSMFWDLMEQIPTLEASLLKESKDASSDGQRLQCTIFTELKYFYLINSTHPCHRANVIGDGD